MSHSEVVLSCVFGDEFQRLYESVPGRPCLFFSNNILLRDEAERKGWIFRYVNTHPLSSDIRISSIQSKYIKFLQFFDEFPDLRDIEKFIYFDHKFFVKDEHLRWIDERFSDGKSIFIRNTPRLKTSIQDEIDDASGQQRYVERMPQTVEWLKRTLRERNLSVNNRIMNTGFIVYKDVNKTAQLLRETYEVVWRLGQPECQIIWGCLSQPYEDFIQRVEWSELNPTWSAPR